MKFSIYLNRRVFVMVVCIHRNHSEGGAVGDCAFQVSSARRNKTSKKKKKKDILLSGVVALKANKFRIQYFLGHSRLEQRKSITKLRNARFN